MSKSIPITLAGEQYSAMPASFKFLKENQERFALLSDGKMTEMESQMFSAEVIVHCIKRAMPEADAGKIEDALDAVEIMRISKEIGVETGKQIAHVMGVPELGEATTG